ncbi:MAG: type II 3-dehydroquinate dehydratase [Bacteroidetes bacterium]|nr:type II 3-dehydroquinate dehydratase [Bacteroidota bacterium]
MNILVCNGPNLNLLGTREPNVYGSQTLREIEEELLLKFPEASLTFFQSNHEGAIIDALQSTIGKHFDGVVINPGAFTHYSYAIRDCIAAISIPVIEIHLSNIHLREKFRRTSVLAPVCMAQISGFGAASYAVAVEMLLYHLSKQKI